MDWVSIALASTTPIAILGGLIQRGRYKRRSPDGTVLKEGLGMGWQFIRFVVLTTGLPLIALLAIKGLLTGEITAVFASAMAFAFGKSGKDA